MRHDDYTLIETPYSNPLAPQWMFPAWGYSQFCESEFSYMFPLSGDAVTIPAAGLMNQQLQFSWDSEFHITDWQVYGVNTAQGTVNTGIEVRLIDGNGKRRINDFIPVLQACGPVPKAWTVPPGGVQRIDFRNTTGGDVTVLIVFRGFKRFQGAACGQIPAGFQPVEYVPLWARYTMPPVGYHDEPYVFQFNAWNVTTAPFNSPLENIPFPLDTDAPFIIRSVTVNATNSDAFTSFAVRLVTPFGNRLVLQANPGSQTQAPGPYALGTNAGGTTFVPVRGRNIYPEIVCPAGSILGLDVQLNMSAGTSSGILRVNGVKRQRD